MRINYDKLEDYKIALEGAKKIVATNYAIVDAKLKSTKIAGELIDDELYASFLSWQLLSVLVRTQELTCDPENMEDLDEDDSEDEDNNIEFDFDFDLDDEEE